MEVGVLSKHTVKENLHMFTLDGQTPGRFVIGKKVSGGEVDGA